MIPIGGIVDVKGHGRATVVKHGDAEDASQAYRVLVCYHEDGSTRWVQFSVLREMHLVS